MPSFRGQCIKVLLQHRHLFRLRFTKEVVDWNKYESILRFRREVEEGSKRFGKIPEGIEIEPVQIGDLYAEWIAPKGAGRKRAILYFHGGGYVTGTCASHRGLSAKFVRGTGTGALLFEYRLAPENPYPAALEDAVASFQWLLAQGVAPSDIVFAGDSAGGGLCFATMLALRDRGYPLPVAAAAFSPVTDFTCSGESHRTKAAVCLSPEGMTQALAKHYAGGEEHGLPYISPLFGDLRGLPPLLIYAGEDEILRDDAVRFAARATEAGVDVSLRIGKKLFHCYPAMAPLFPEATQAMDEICAFITAHLGRHPAGVA